MHALVHQDRRLYGRLRLLLSVRATQDVRQANTADEGDALVKTGRAGGRVGEGVGLGLEGLEGGWLGGW